MKKSLLTIALLGLISMQVQATISTALYTQEDSWNFIEYYFVTQPNAQQNLLRNRLARWGTTGIAALTGFLSIRSILDNIINAQERSGEYTERNKHYINLAAGFGSSILGHQAISMYQQDAIEYNNLLKFINEWPTEYQRYTPEILRPTFEKLYKEYKTNPLSLKEHNSEIIDHIKNVIYVKFVDKYQPSTHIPTYITNFFTHKSFNVKANFDFAVGSALDGISKIITALKEKK